MKKKEDKTGRHISNGYKVELLKLFKREGLNNKLLEPNNLVKDLTESLSIDTLIDYIIDKYSENQHKLKGPFKSKMDKKVAREGLLLVSILDKYTESIEYIRIKVKNKKVVTFRTKTVKDLILGAVLDYEQSLKREKKDFLIMLYYQYKKSIQVSLKCYQLRTLLRRAYSRKNSKGKYLISDREVNTITYFILESFEILPKSKTRNSCAAFINKHYKEHKFESELEMDDATEKTMSIPYINLPSQ